ncbi:hypothetical protein AR457_41710 (plasmid) [Streptomyces agglomeratus]|uniref:DUF6233 domain-containing protein n=1 Tax=Streptomyces agglomeratus TaxID=285458 RepID=UPI000854A85B|nr:DUF6233 domain-containing protein [Streptomyces agglomeratus]OEJ20796.1 hypothetical protein AR457_41710 [Streptomyces agglomeratus]
MPAPFDLPPDLPRLRTLETFLLALLAWVRERITSLEQQAVIHEKIARQRPPAEWTLEISINGHTPMRVHVGEGCALSGTQVRTREISRQEAIRWIGDGVEACPLCHPDSLLRIFE